MLRRVSPRHCMILLSELRPILKPTPVIFSSEFIESSLKSEDLLLPRDATTVDLRITPGTSVPSLSRQRLLRIQEHHSLRFDHLARSRNHQATLPSNPHHLDVNHLGASSATTLDTLLETAYRNSPQQWSINIRATTGPHHNSSTSSSKTIHHTRTSLSTQNLMIQTNQYKIVDVQYHQGK